MTSTTINNKLTIIGTDTAGIKREWKLDPTGQPYSFFAHLILAGYETWSISSGGINPVEDGEHFCAWNNVSNRVIELINKSSFENVKSCLKGRLHPETVLVRILAATGC